MTGCPEFQPVISGSIYVYVLCTYMDSNMLDEDNEDHQLSNQFV